MHHVLHLWQYLHGCGGGDETPTTTLTSTSTTAVVPTGPSGLKWCEGLVTYYKHVVDKDGVKSATGQCLPSTTPGAFWTKPGEKDEDGKSDRSWMCLNEDFPHDLWTDEGARQLAFEGVCLFQDYNSTKTPEDVEDCSEHLNHHPASCAPGPSAFWGACWSKHSENWKCIPTGDGTIDGLAKGDCRSQVLLKDGTSDPTPYFYDGVCRFEQETSKLYKCDTAPDYSSTDATTCGQKVDSSTDKACFTLKHGAHWQCTPKGQNISQPCDWTLLPDGSKDFYRGACVFPNNDLYSFAADAHDLNATRLEAIVI